MAHLPRVMSGISKVEMAPIGPVSGSTVWTELFCTLEDSVTFNQPTPARTDIRVDCKTAPLKSIYTEDTATCEMIVPDIAKEILDELFVTAVPAFVPAGMTATGVSFEVKVLNKMLRITSDDAQDIVVFTNASIVSNFEQIGTKTTASAIKITAAALAPATGGEPMPFIVYSKTDAATTYYTWKKYASDALGTGLSDTRGVLTWIGVAPNKTTAIESTNPLDYQWYQIEA